GAGGHVGAGGGLALVGERGARNKATLLFGEAVAAFEEGDVAVAGAACERLLPPPRTARPGGALLLPAPREVVEHLAIHLLRANVPQLGGKRLDVPGRQVSPAVCVVFPHEVENVFDRLLFKAARLALAPRDLAEPLLEQELCLLVIGRLRRLPPLVLLARHVVADPIGR